MIKPTVVTWILLGFGWVFIFLVLFFAQLLMVLRPDSRRTKDIIIGKGEEWHDRTHKRFSLGGAFADLMVLLPLLAAGSVGVILGQEWGYILWAASGAIAAYISIILYVTEKELVYPHCGPLAYYTYYWGIPLYWGVAVVAYSVLRLSGVKF